MISVDPAPAVQESISLPIPVSGPVKSPTRLAINLVLDSRFCPMAWPKGEGLIMKMYWGMRSGSLESKARPAIPMAAERMGAYSVLVDQIRPGAQMVSPVIMASSITVSMTRNMVIMGKTIILAKRLRSQELKPTLELGKAPMAISSGPVIILKIILT